MDLSSIKSRKTKKRGAKKKFQFTADTMNDLSLDELSSVNEDGYTASEGTENNETPSKLEHVQHLERKGSLSSIETPTTASNQNLQQIMDESDDIRSTQSGQSGESGQCQNDPSDSNSFESSDSDKFITHSYLKKNRKHKKKSRPNGNQIGSKYGEENLVQYKSKLALPLEKNMSPRIEILFEDEDVIVINKPRNLAVHPSPGHTDDSVVHQVLQHFGNDRSCLSNIDCTSDIDRPGIVHRIDWQTSGVLVLARNNESHQFLKEQFKVHSVERVYYCLTHHHFRELSCKIDAAIGRHPTIPNKRVATNNSIGKPQLKKKQTFKHAITHVKVLKSLEDGSGNKYSLVECRLETGRTHQIRVHLSMLGRALVGDTLYGSKRQPFRITGQILHAKSLGFIHPRTKELMKFESPLPEYFQDILDKLKPSKL